jgi:hypothetical protein
VEELLFQLLNMHSISEVRQIEVHTAEPSVSGHSRPEVEIAIAKFKNCKSPDNNQIPAELIQTRGETLLLEIKNKLSGLSPRANYTDRATAACRRS